MQGSGELLLSRILEELTSLSKENKEVLQKLYENSVLDTEQSGDISSIKEKIKQIIDRLDQLEARVGVMEKSRIEMSGFAKYIKILWALIAAVTTYIISLGINK